MHNLSSSLRIRLNDELNTYIKRKNLTNLTGKQCAWREGEIIEDLLNARGNFNIYTESLVRLRCQ